jgi:hypothetical protein
MRDPRHLTLRDAQSLSHGDPGERAALAQGGERFSIGSAAGGGVPTANREIAWTHGR